MAEKSKPATDLLGDPWTDAPETRGRKSHRRSVQVAELVAVLRAGGSTEIEIAERVGLSAPTLRKYYFRELEMGPNLARSMVRQKLWDAGVNKGNVAALKALDAMFTQGDAAVPIKPERRAPVARPLGKKEAAEAEAKTAHEGTDWGELLH